MGSEYFRYEPVINSHQLADCSTEMNLERAFGAREINFGFLHKSCQFAFGTHNRGRERRLAPGGARLD